MRRNHRFLVRTAAAVAASLAVAACGSVKDDLGLEKKAPDEFAVVRNAPLSLPPNFNLRPPKPGEVGDARLDQRDQARALLVSGQPASANSANAMLAASGTGTQPASYSFVAGRDGGALGELSDYRLSAAGGAASGGRMDASEMALLGRLDAVNPDPNIRQRVDQESQLLAVDDRNMVERLMFWREPGEPGVIVEPSGEAKRINENSALGNPVTDGETPDIPVERLSSGFSGIKIF